MEIRRPTFMINLKSTKASAEISKQPRTNPRMKIKKLEELEEIEDK